MDFDTIPDGDEPGYEQPQFDNVAGDDIVEGSDNYYEVEDSAEEVPVLPPPVPQMDFLPEPEAPVLPDPEPEENALTIFMAKWSKELEEKREREFQHEKEARKKAEEDLAGWKVQREKRLQAKKESNRAEEAGLKENVDSEANNLKTWDRVSKLIDAGTERIDSGADVSRMRGVFIQLKNEPLERTRAANV